MKLFFRTIGEGVPLIILHGLWGASENWLPIAHLLEDKFQVILPDIRNHGQSPHDEAMNYEVMSNDVIELVEDLKLPVPPHIDGREDRDGLITEKTRTCESSRGRGYCPRILFPTGRGKS